MYYSGGNVGVGTTNPGAKISVTASANSMIAGFTGGNAAGIYPSYDGSLYLSQNFSGGFAEQDIWNTLSPTLYPSTGIRFLQQTATSSYADLLFLKNNGNVGIGTATPGYPLTIYSASTSTLWLGNPGGARRNVWYYFRCMGRSQQGLENL